MWDEHIRQDDFFCAITTGWDTCLFKHIEKNCPLYFVCTNALFEKIILYPQKDAKCEMFYYWKKLSETFLSETEFYLETFLSETEQKHTENIGKLLPTRFMF